MTKAFGGVIALMLVAVFAGEAVMLSASPASAAEVSGRHHRRHYGGPNFKHWCAYNCYAISPCYRGCLGRYGYRFYAYDQDLPFRYRYDRDGSPLDNGLGIVYPVTGEWYLRLFERRY